MEGAEDMEEGKKSPGRGRKKQEIIYPFEINDLLFPGGKVTKLCRVKNH